MYLPAHKLISIDTIRDDIIHYVDITAGVSPYYSSRYSDIERLKYLSACSLVHSSWRYRSQELLFSCIDGNNYGGGGLQQVLMKDGKGGRLRGYVKAARWVDGGIDEELFQYFEKLERLECESLPVAWIMCGNEKCASIIAKLRELILFDGLVDSDFPVPPVRLSSLEHLFLSLSDCNDFFELPFSKYLPKPPQSTITALTLLSSSEDWSSILPLVGSTLKWLTIEIQVVVEDVELWKSVIKKLKVLEVISIRIKSQLSLTFLEYIIPLPPTIKSISFLDFHFTYEAKAIVFIGEQVATTLFDSKRFPDLISIQLSTDSHLLPGFEKQKQRGEGRVFQVIHPRDQPVYRLGMYPTEVINVTQVE